MVAIHKTWIQQISDILWLNLFFQTILFVFCVTCNKSTVGSMHISIFHIFFLSHARMSYWCKINIFDAAINHKKNMFTYQNYNTMIYMDINVLLYVILNICPPPHLFLKWGKYITSYVFDFKLKVNITRWEKTCIYKKFLYLTTVRGITQYTILWMWFFLLNIFK